MLKRLEHEDIRCLYEQVPKILQSVIRLNWILPLKWSDIFWRINLHIILQKHTTKVQFYHSNQVRSGRDKGMEVIGAGNQRLQMMESNGTK